MPDSQSMRLHVLDVGHGDSLLIEFPNRDSWGIIDCNCCDKSNRPLDDEHDSSEPRILSTIRMLHRKLAKAGKRPTIEFLCLTHPDLDHFDGYARLIDGLFELDIPVRRFWTISAAELVANVMAELATATRVKSKKKAFREFKLLYEAKLKLRNRNTNFHTLTASLYNEPFHSCQGVSIEALAPSFWATQAFANYLKMRTPRQRQQFRKTYGDCDNYNLISSALLLTYGQCRMILGGDLTNIAWKDVLWGEDGKQVHDRRCHAIKISHHGSKNGNFPKRKPLCDNLRYDDAPLIAAISGGYRKKLPHPETLESLKEAICEVYVTGAQVADLPSFRATSPAGHEARDDLERLGVREVTYEIKPHCGDIHIDCFPDGRCETHTEFKV